MHGKHLSSCLVLLALALAGCGSAEAPEPAPEPRAERPRDPSVFDPLTSTIDRAQGVQQTLDDSAAARRRALEEAE